MIYWNNIQLKIRTTVLLNNISLQLKKGDSLGIIGANGTGKTVLAKGLAGKIPSYGNKTTNDIKTTYVSFQSDFQLKHGARGYRQQRWNPVSSEFIPTVGEKLNKLENQEELQRLVQQFNFENHLDRYVISLSNGEQRKFELIKALSEKPDLLIIDNAFNGLDKASRELLSEMLNLLVASGRSVVLTELQIEDFPQHFTQFIYIDTKKKCHNISRKEIPEIYPKVLFENDRIPNWKNSDYNEIVYLNDVHFEINEKPILKNINWAVNAGECWVLSGKNGSGKTSLLNMIFADNPKAYQCNICLFGKAKGSGESIWEIKDKIGFVSPEMHQYLPGKQTVNDVICSGFFISEGLYKEPTSFQRNLAAQWLQLVELRQLNNVIFNTLPASAQRIVLILRALVKNPPLILLDEPFQGLDFVNIERMKFLLNTLAENTNVAMIFVSHFRDKIPSAFNNEIHLNNGEIEFISK